MFLLLEVAQCHGGLCKQTILTKSIMEVELTALDTASAEAE
jgi:hypothetical protein